MSIESARNFLRKVAKDEEFREQLSDCTSRAEQLQFAREGGFDFTPEEMAEVRDELQDEDLDQVSGGGCGCLCESDYCTGVET